MPTVATSMRGFAAKLRGTLLTGLPQRRTRFAVWVGVRPSGAYPQFIGLTLGWIPAVMACADPNRPKASRFSLVRLASGAQHAELQRPPNPTPTNHSSNSFTADVPSHGSIRPRTALTSLVSLWVPETVSPQATCAYSWIRPPSRSRRRTRMVEPSVGGRARPSGGFCCSVRCGRWVL
jgi:hypothetical protein